MAQANKGGGEGGDRRPALGGRRIDMSAKAPKAEAPSRLEAQPSQPARADAPPTAAKKAAPAPEHRRSKSRAAKNPANNICRNCGARLAGPYCHVCGQAGKEPRRAVIGLVQDVFVETLAIDGKLLRTIALLLTRPGVLARRFLEGKRVRYSPPFRLYLFTSVFYFFAVFLIFGGPQVTSVEQAESIDEVRDAVRAELRLDAQPGNGEPEDEPAEDDAAAADADGEAVTIELPFQDRAWDPSDYNGPAWLEPFARGVYEGGQRVMDDQRLFFSEVKQNIPRFLLLAPIVYGLTLTLLYIYGRRFFVYDHFIVSLYMHAALYAYLLAALLISQLPVVGFLWFVPILWGLWQPIAMLRQAYGSNWFSVWTKWFISTVIYAVAFAMIILLGVTVSLYNS